MSEHDPKMINPISFLQAFIVQSIRIATTECTDSSGNYSSHVEKVGLASSHCMETVARQNLGFEGKLDQRQYANLIVEIKRLIGGQFRQQSTQQDYVQVINHCCPFGDMVKEAPELCRMTSSVFGAIAARNFGYAKVQLHKRIATGDGMCDVRIYLNPASAAQQTGDEYHGQDDTVSTHSANADATRHLEAMLRKAWCPAQRHNQPARPKQRRIVAESQIMRKALRAVEIVGPTPANVLITGETGVGKEVISRAVHALSQRADRIFLPVNCGAIPENLIESVLFGHAKGAFTDAHRDHEGLFERANQGTLFLDEVDCLPLAAQARLLRVLQEGEYERVGGRQPRFTDTRIIAAANSNLESLVASGRFRRDLYYRLNVVPIHLPPLRERPDDITPLVTHFLQQIAEKYSGPLKVLNELAWAKVLGYSWPGNLREMENVLERSYLFASSEIISEILLDTGKESMDSPLETLREAKQRASLEIERRIIKHAMLREQGNVSAVAKQIGITPRAVHMKLRSHGIDASSYRQSISD